MTDADIGGAACGACADPGAEPPTVRAALRGLGRALARAAADAGRRWRERRRLARAAEELRALDDRMLRDLGLEPDDVGRALRGAGRRG